MGINTHYYTVYGIVHNHYDEEFSETVYDELYDVVENHEDLDIIMDGMGGDYMIIGKILFDSGDLRWSEIKDTFVKINPNHLKMYQVKATTAFREIFPDNEKLLEGEWQLLTLMHLS